jgi:nucleolar protein 12
VDNKRCVFVGNLGFVDDESNIQAANEEEGKEKRKPGKYPADIEEGLWRTFGKCGTVESVRVVRDSTTRVGKGIAYVQFDDANAVEAALLYDGKKFPPMLPRKLRVSRARAQKRNSKPDSSASTSRPTANGYRRKVTSEEASRNGRANKLFGRAAALQMKKDNKGGRQVSNGINAPEKLVFEGHRASSKGGKSGLKLGRPGKKKPGKPTTRSAKRGAAFKAANKAKTK